MPDWHLHDLRRTGATVMGKLGASDSIVDRCLNHTLPKLTRTYNKSDYKPEMADALQKLADGYDRLMVYGKLT